MMKVTILGVDGTAKHTEILTPVRDGDITRYTFSENSPPVHSGEHVVFTCSDIWGPDGELKERRETK